MENKKQYESPSIYTLIFTMGLIPTFIFFIMFIFQIMEWIKTGNINTILLLRATILLAITIFMSGGIVLIDFVQEKGYYKNKQKEKSNG